MSPVTTNNKRERNMSKEQTGCRPVRIHVALKETDPVRRALEQVFGVIGDPKTHNFVKTIREADLVIFTETKAIEMDYSISTRTYAYIDGMAHDKPNLPTGVVRLSMANTVVSLVELIQKVWLTLKPTEENVSVAAKVQVRPDALRVLVIDDTPKHIVSAESGLAEHRLTTATGYEQAMQILGNEKFDVVLTDLEMPMSSNQLASHVFKLGELVPYGVLIAIEAAHRGAKFVAVVTDGGHHHGPFQAAIDYFRTFPVKIEKAKMVMMHAPMKDGAKDWATALDILMKD